MTVLQTLETWSRVTPFGVRFVDDMSGRVVADAMQVTAWPTSEPSRARLMPRNGGDAFYLMNAPGLRNQEFGMGDDAYWSTLSRTLGFTIEVEDLFGRFLPFRFAVDLPHRNLYRLACGSPPSNVPLPDDSESDGVPLFTAPARPPTPGTVVIRAELWDASNHQHARWAMLEARTPGQRLRNEAPRRALADHLGRVALHFPIPEERDFDGGTFDSPSGLGDTSLSERTWSVELDAAYGEIEIAPGTEQRPFPPIPNLCTALSQPPAKLWDQLGGSPTPLAPVTLRVRQEHFVRSSDAGSEPASVLLLTPSTSPP